MQLTKTASNGHHTFTLTVNETATSTANNTSTVSFSLSLAPNGYDWYYSGSQVPVTYSININGTLYTGNIMSYTAHTTLTIRSGSQTVTHNADGKKTINVGFEINTLVSAYYLPGYASASGTLTLTSIPRYPSISQTLSSRTETTLTIKWSSDTVCDYLWYSTNGGTSFTGIDIADGTSGTYTVSGLSVGTAYSVVTRVRSKASRLTKDSSAVSYWTYDYPYSNLRPTFTVGESVKIGLANPMNRSCTVQILAGGTVAATGTTSGTEITLTPSAATLYAAIPSASSGTYTVKVTWGTHYTERTGTFNASTAASPTASSLTYADTSTLTTSITEDNQKIVQNRSTVAFTLSGLAGYEGSTVESATLSVAGYTYAMSISGTNASVSNVRINSSADVVATATIIDSRGARGTLSATVTMIEYSKPTAIYSIKRKNNFYSETDITVNAQISSIEGKNTVEVSYQYKKTTDATFGSWHIMSNVTETITLDNAFAWNIRLRLMDRLISATYIPADDETFITIPVGTPILFIDRIKQSLGVNCLPTLDGSVEVDGHDIRRSAITLSLSADISSPTSGAYTQLNLDAETSFGSHLSASNGGIEIGAGVSKVMVSARLGLSTSGSAVRYARICKNSYSVDNTLDWISETHGSGEYVNMVIPPTLVDVQEGDVLYLYYYVNSGDSVKGSASARKTSLTVEYIA